MKFEVLKLILRPEIHHPNDVTIKYLIDIMPKKLHHYLKLPGKFVCNYPTRLIRRDGSQREMDWLMLVEPDGEAIFEKILINVEFQSSSVGKEKIKVIADYRDYSKTYYGFPVLTIIVITRGYESSEREYSRVSSDIIRPEYIFLNWDEIIERLKSIEDKIDNQKQLSDDEALDIVFLPMSARKNKAKFVTEKLTNLFANDVSLTGSFRNDIGFALSIMVKKHFDITDKGKELLKMLEGEVQNSRLRDVVEFEVAFAKRVFEKELAEKDEVISEKDLALCEKDEEITLLKAKLKENGIE